ncbi:hypothetical protein RB595_001670 [Gaeumannomyces hyphopodioides]
MEPLLSSLVSTGRGGQTPASESLSAAQDPGIPLANDVYRDASEDEDQDDDGSLDGGTELIAGAPSKPRKISEKKRADNAIFESWVERNKVRLSQASSNAKPNDKGGSTELESDPTADKPSRPQGMRVIEGPREYQIELFERAKQKNTIAVLDTGTGKTLISILLIRHIIEKELEARSQGKENRAAFFLVDKVTLVWQQTKQLHSNLDFAITGIHGDSVAHLWGDVEFWKKLRNDNMVIVCTADILYTCLARGYINIRQINLLVFDEAHHTKKNHPYARIIKDFYVTEEDTDMRPRVLGMTASPFDTKTIHIEKAASELERLLHSEIATIVDAELLKAIGSRAEERNVPYAFLHRREPTDLCKKLEALVGSHSQFNKAFSTAKIAVTELGPWCADRLWELKFRDDSGLEGRAEGNRRGEDCDWQIGGTDHIDDLREAASIVSNSTLGPPRDDGLSSKTLKLLEILEENFSSETSTQCIVFVERRDVAVLLTDLVKHPAMSARFPYLNAAFLIASGRGDTHVSTSNKKQEATVWSFRLGELNCLFATSIAEEGLDIPGCNLVIRFDLHKTTIQYIQSRGRARMAGSVFIQMTEMGNQDHMRGWYLHQANERTMRQFCAALPEDRILQRIGADMDAALHGDQGQKVYVVPETSARLTYRHSLTVLAEYVATLPTNVEGVGFAPEYTVIPVLGGFQGEVLLPESSPLRSATGSVQRSKAVAKCSAAYAMCISLIEAGYLDTHLKSTFRKILPLMRNARLAVSSKKKAQYDMQTKPDMWSDLGTPSRLFATALVLTNPEALLQDSRPLLLLTRKPLPQVAPIPLFIAKRRRSDVQCIPLPPVGTTETDLLGLSSFTLCIFRDVFSKDFDGTAANLPYFLAPMTKGHEYAFSEMVDSHGLVDWQAIDAIQVPGTMPDSHGQPDEFFQHKFVTDPFDGSRKFFMRKVRRDLTPQDNVPEDVPAPAHRSWRTAEHTIMNYSVSLWSKSRDAITPRLRKDSPVIEAELVSLRRNLLDQTDAESAVPMRTCFLVLETLQISRLSAEAVSMAYNFPAIIYRLENSLIALDCCNLLGLSIRPHLALEAMTKDSDNSDEPGEEPVNFQSGMGKNYERLEFLGDCFLKMATTIALFTLMVGDEFEYHVERMTDICNKNLLNVALDMGLQKYIRSKSFNRRTWYPSGLTLLKGKRLDADVTHSLGDKSIADVCEALIGAAYLTGRERNSFDIAVKAVTLLTRSKTHTMNSFAEYHAAYVKPEWQTAPASRLQMELARQIKERMGYEFKDARLLRSAFMHPSYPRVYENIPSYQRLEFLGDALLDMACIDHVFGRFPDRDPQWLTEHKMAMVSNQFYGCLAVELGFHRHVVCLKTQLQGQIADWVDKLGERRRRAEKAAEDAGRPAADFARNFWVDMEHPPKCLPDVLEAYVGALFVDAGYDYGVVEAFWARHVQPWFADMAAYDTYSAHHPVTYLNSILVHRLGCTHHRLLVREIADTASGEGIVTGATKVVAACLVHGEVHCHAASASGRYAKLAVAKKAIAMFGTMDQAEFRRLTGCDCKPGQDGAVAGGDDGDDDGGDGNAEGAVGGGSRGITSAGSGDGQGNGVCREVVDSVV